MSFLLNTPIRTYHSPDVYLDGSGNYHIPTRWMVSTSLDGSFTLTRGDAARIIWERNPQWIL